MDKLDTRIILEMMKNSRVPVTSLAKKLKASREVITYRINKLVKEKVILGFVTEIGIEKLGFVGAAVFISIKSKRHKEFIQFLNNCGFVSWVAELSGVWSFGFSIYGKSNEELDQKFRMISQKFKGDIIDYRFTLHRRTEFFYEKYFGGMTLPVKNKIIDYKIDQKDKIILRELAKNSRIESVMLSKKAGLSAPAVSRRIRSLERSGIIGRFSLFIDISKAGLLQYSIFVVNKDVESLPKLVSYLCAHPNVSFVAEYVADPFLEFGITVSDTYRLRGILQEIEESFPDNRIMEVSLFQKEFLSVGSPKCVFE